MRKIFDDCVGCDRCFGSPCELKRAEHILCDDCEEDITGEEIYTVNGDELCEKCFMKRYLSENQDERHGGQCPVCGGDMHPALYMHGTIYDGIYDLDGTELCLDCLRETYTNGGIE